MLEAKIDEFPCIFPASREFSVFRDGFARDCLLQRRVVQTIGSAWKAFSERDSEFESGFLQRRVLRTRGSAAWEFPAPSQRSCFSANH